MSKRILFLYISPASGHQHAADATREALTLLEPGWLSYGIDSFSYAYPTIGKLIAAEARPRATESHHTIV